MQLRHCPIRAQKGGSHQACSRCDALPPEERISAHGLIDRKNVRFPLGRLKTEAGCIVRLYNSAPLFLLRHTARLPESAAWRLLLTDESRDEALEAVALHRLALDGGGHLTYLASTRVNLSVMEERWPDISFRATREH